MASFGPFSCFEGESSCEEADASCPGKYGKFIGSLSPITTVTSIGNDGARQGAPFAFATAGAIFVPKTEQGTRPFGDILLSATI